MNLRKIKYKLNNNKITYNTKTQIWTVKVGRQNNKHITTLNKLLFLDEIND